MQGHFGTGNPIEYHSKMTTASWESRAESELRGNAVTSLSGIKVLMWFCLSFNELPSRPLHRELRVFMKRGLQKGICVYVCATRALTQQGTSCCTVRATKPGQLISYPCISPCNCAFNSSLRFINGISGIWVNHFLDQTFSRFISALQSWRIKLIISLNIPGHAT